VRQLPIFGLSRYSQSLAIDDWVNWFVGITGESVKITQNIIDFTLEKARFMKRHQADLNERQLQVVLNLFANGADGDARSVNRNKYVNQAHCSPRTALRDLNDLVEKDVLVKLPGLGRNTRYGLNKAGDRFKEFSGLSGQGRSSGWKFNRQEINERE